MEIDEHADGYRPNPKDWDIEYLDRRAMIYRKTAEMIDTLAREEEEGEREK